MSGEASADLNLVNAKTKRDFNSPRTNVIGEQFGADSTLSASGMLGALPKKARANSIEACLAVLKPLQVQKQAPAEGALVWERKNDYSDVLRDHFR